MQFSRQKNFFVVLILAAVLTSGASFAFKGDKNFIASEKIKFEIGKNNFLANIVGGLPKNKLKVAPTPPLPPEKLKNPPAIINAVYVTGYSAGNQSYLKYLSNLFNQTQINAVVIDIKGSDGKITYNSGSEEVKKYSLSGDMISDIDYLVRFFHDQNIYVIGRIAVFQDPQYAMVRPELAIYNIEKSSLINPEKSERILWKDNNGLYWLDPASKDVWAYNVSLAKDAFYHGFDEINFDYVRFATDGDMKNMGFPIYDKKIAKAEVIKEFFKYLRTELKGEKISADLFGLTTINTDDMGIGQIIENAFENFDYVCPMVYPSHYANGFIGFRNPAEHPYEVVKYSMDNAKNKERILFENIKNEIIKRSEVKGMPAASLQLLNPLPEMQPLAKIRPWLQDFDMGADYTAEMVKKEISATADSLAKDYAGYMLWNPSNKYTKEAIIK